MNPSNQNPLLWIVASLWVAACLMLYPLPDLLAPLRPEWLVLCGIYWILLFPYRVGLWSAWVLGLGIDMLQGGLLGEHALACVVVAYIMVRGHHRIRLFPRGQQMLVIFSVLLLYHGIIFLVQGLMGALQGGVWRGVLSAGITALLWPCFWSAQHRVSIAGVIRTI